MCNLVSGVYVKIGVLFFFVALLLAGYSLHAEQPLPAPVHTGQTRVAGFIANVGQWPSNVLFFVRRSNKDIWITRNGTICDSYRIEPELGLRTGSVTKQVFAGSNPAGEIVVDKESARVTFLHGTDASRAYSAPVYQSVTILDIFPGVAVRYHVGTDPMKHVVRTLVIGSGANQSNVKMYTDDGHSDVASLTNVPTSFVYGSYIGGVSDDEVVAVARSSSGNVIVCGNTTAIEFPGVVGGYSTSSKGGVEVFVALFDAKLQQVKAYTFLGGDGTDRARSMCIDDENSIYMTGETSSANFPITSGASGQLYKSGTDCFIAKLDSTLGKLLVGGYHGGNKEDIPRAIAVNSSRQIYIAGGSTSTANFPVTFPITVTIRLFLGGTRTEPGGGRNEGQTDGFIASFSPNGSLQQSRFFGREGVESFAAMVLDGSSSVYLTGSTTSANFETAPTPGRFSSSSRLPYDRTYNGGNSDAFVVKLNNELALAKTDDGTYSTFFGGDGEEAGRGIFVDNLGRAYVSGVTNSKNLPTLSTLVTQPIGNQDVWLAVFSDDGRELVSATYFGGTGNDDVSGMVRYQNTTAVIFGSTQSNDFPTTGEGSVSDRAGLSDGFMAVINTSTNKFTTLLQGAAEDTVLAAVVDPLGDIYYLASTNSSDHRTPDTTYDATRSGKDGFVGKLAFGVLELLTPSGAETWCVGGSRTISWSTNGFADSVKYLLEVAPAAEESWSVLAKNVMGRSYQWKIGAFETGQYRVRISSSRGHRSQLITPFSISTPPIITVQPKNLTACLGLPVTLSIGAAGAGLKYQWKENGVDIAGATTSTYVVPSVGNATIGPYSCAVSGVCNPRVVSQTVTVAVASATLIATQPASTTVEQGKTLTLSVSATGSDLTYQWRKNNVPISGATASEYMVPATLLSDAGMYSCEVSGGCETVMSDNATVVVTPSTSVTDDAHAKSTWLQLIGPLPSSDHVIVRTDLSFSESLVARVIDTEGRIVAVFDLGTVAAGPNDVSIIVSNFASGVYAIEFKAGRLVGRVTTIVRR